MEGRPSPVYVIKVGDEQKRQEVFDRAFRSVFLSENTRAVLDGTRIPQIEIPDFINAILRILGINAPAPYYVVQDGYLFISDSADALLASINAIRKNAVLPKSTLWQDLSKSGSDKSSFSLFYSLDRSLPFFLRGNTAFNTLLRLYRQGLVRLGFEKNTLRVFLSAVPGTGRGIRAVPGYPLDLQGRAGSAVYGVFSERRESRLLLTRDNSALAINPANRDLYELKNPFPVTVIPAAGLAAKTMNDGAAWVAGGGQVILVNGNMEPVNGFPLITGVRTASPPSAHGGKLYLPDEDGPLYVVNADTTMSLLETGFIAGLRSPPVFLDAGGKTYMASYAKSLPGEIWLQDDGGNTYPGWPITVSRIAFGSPLLFAQDGGVFLAFITQRGDLNLYDEGGMPRQNFPITLPGVFFVQPVFDGESLWTAASDGTLYQVQLDGTVLHQRIPNLKVEEAGRINAVDVDGDGKAEIFVTGEGNALYGYSRNFSSLDGFPLPVWGQPAFADLNGDGKIECTGIGLDNRLYQWQFK
jgi:hypothetical protein